MFAQTTNVMGPVQVESHQTLTELSLPPLRGDSRRQNIYVHVPFCSHKCGYCDYFSLVDTSERHRLFVDRLIQEMEEAAPMMASRPSTIFMGGGTPSLLETRLWERLIEAVGTLLRPFGDAEFTTEANPETVSADWARTLVQVNEWTAGFRVSLGAQSFDPRLLAVLQRNHEPGNVSNAVNMCRKEGIENISLDLIFGIPGQSPADWKRDLKTAIALEPDHVSCYGLTCEQGTPLAGLVEVGRVKLAEEETEAAMYEAAIDILGEAGYEHYEISNWARPGRRCRHNMACWRNEDYWPLGPGAAGHRQGLRWRNSPDLDAYLRIGPLPPIVDVEHPDEDREAGEQLMLGLRLIEGIEDEKVERILQRGRRGQQRRDAIDRHVADGLLMMESGRLRLTRRGLLLADLVLIDLV